MTVLSLPAQAQKVEQAARDCGLAIHVHEMTQTTRTAEEAAIACGCRVGQIVKSLVFEGRETGNPYLFLVSGDNRVNENGVSSFLGEGVQRPDAKRVREWTGFAIGGIPPLGHQTVLKTFMDSDLLRYDIVWAAAGTPFHVFPVEPHRLATAVQATITALA